MKKCGGNKVKGDTGGRAGTNINCTMFIITVGYTLFQLQALLPSPPHL